MAQTGVFDAAKTYACRLFYNMLDNQPLVIGHLAADTVDAGVDPFGQAEYAVLTVDLPTADRPYPVNYAGTYYLPMAAKSSWFTGELDASGHVVYVNGQPIPWLKV